MTRIIHFECDGCGVSEKHSGSGNVKVPAEWNYVMVTLMGLPRTLYSEGNRDTETKGYDLCKKCTLELWKKSQPKLWKLKKECKENVDQSGSGSGEFAGPRGL